MQALNYLLLQLKRVSKLLPGTLAMIVSLAVIIGAGAYAFICSGTYAESMQKYQIGVVGSGSDELLGLGILLIQNIDDSKYMINIVQYDDEEEAQEAMRKAEVTAYIVLTPEFTEALDRMTNDAKAKYYSTSGAKGITNVLMDELSSIATSIIVHSQAGIFCLRDYLYDQGYTKKQVHTAINDLFTEYMYCLLDRGEATRIVELGISGGLTTPAYYSTGMLLFFLLMLSFCGISFFLGTKNAMHQFMGSKGIGPVKQVALEYIAYLALNLSCALFIMLIIGIISERLRFSLEDIGIYAIDSIGQLTELLIPIIILFSAMSFAMFESLVGVINKILVTFLLYLSMGYISGFFYPKNVFPRAVQGIGDFLPTGIAFSYLGDTFNEISVTKYVLAGLLYLVLFALISIYSRYKKIVKG